LDPALADAGAAIALEAAWRAILEVAHGAVDAVRRTLAGASATHDPSGAAVPRTLAGAPAPSAPPVDAVQQIEHFLESLSLETTDLGMIGPRLVRLTHALDHLTQLHDDLTRIPSATSRGHPPGAFEAGAQALAAWLGATKDPEAAPDPAIFATLEDASKRLS